MIRITSSEEGSNKVVRIAGRIEEQHLAELQRLCSASGRTVAIDLSDLQSADSAGIQWLHYASRQGTAIVGASPYITLLIDRAAQRFGTSSEVADR